MYTKTCMDIPATISLVSRKTGIDGVIRQVAGGDLEAQVIWDCPGVWMIIQVPCGKISNILTMDIYIYGLIWITT